MIKTMRLKISLILLCCLTFSATTKAQEITTIYLVRHAEKVDSSRNSGLTELGKLRAQAFSKLLQGAQLTHVFSTPFIRTRDTAAPTALMHQLEIEEYDADKAAQFASKLRTLPGTVLVVGHSNTIPDLVNRLTGENFEALDERVYDKVYIVKYEDDLYSSLEIIHTEPRTPLP